MPGLAHLPAQPRDVDKLRAARASSRNKQVERTQKQRKRKSKRTSSKLMSASKKKQGDEEKSKKEVKKEKELCTYFMEDRCTFGERCRYSHDPTELEIKEYQVARKNKVVKQHVEEEKKEVVDVEKQKLPGNKKVQAKEREGETQLCTYGGTMQF